MAHRLTDEWSKLRVLPDGSESKSQPNDYADSALYAHRYCRAYLYHEPVPNTEDYGDKRMKILQDKIDEEKRAERRAMGLLIPGGW